MTKTLLEKLSSKINDVYDLNLAEELTDTFVDLTDQIKEDSYRYFNLVKKLAKLEVKKEKIEKGKERRERIVSVYKDAYKVAKEVFDEERERGEKIETEKEQAEYDKEYFANFAKELLENREDEKNL